MPTFGGPWAGEFETAYQSTTSDLAREVLRDGQITQPEMVEVDTALRACLGALGLRDIDTGNYGSLGFVYPAGTDQTTYMELYAQALSCQVTTGWDAVAELYVMIRRSPNKEDPSRAIADCLVRIGLKPPGYTAETYRAENEAGIFDAEWPNDSPEYPLFYSCWLDPLHAA